MPCKDITDILEIVLDDKNCLKEYSLSKKTCGKDINSDPTAEKILIGKTSDEIIDLNISEIIASDIIENKETEFFTVKHLVAVKTGLSVMLGKSSGSTNDYCTIVKIEQSPEETIFKAQISGKGLKEEFKSCGYYDGD